MSYPRRPRSVLAQLLDAGKKRRGCDWPEIDAEVGITKSTRESWLNGNVRDPSLRGVIKLASALSIEPEEVFAAVLDDQLPAWAQPEALTGEAAAELHAEIADALSEKDAETPRRREGRGRRPRSNGPRGA